MGVRGLVAGRGFRMFLEGSGGLFVVFVVLVGEPLEGVRRERRRSRPEPRERRLELRGVLDHVVGDDLVGAVSRGGVGRVVLDHVVGVVVPLGSPRFPALPAVASSYPVVLVVFDVDDDRRGSPARQPRREGRRRRREPVARVRGARVRRALLLASLPKFSPFLGGRAARRSLEAFETLLERRALRRPSLHLCAQTLELVAQAPLQKREPRVHRGVHAREDRRVVVGGGGLRR